MDSKNEELKPSVREKKRRRPKNPNRPVTGKGKIRDISQEGKKSGEFPWKAVVITAIITALAAGLTALYFTYDYEERKYAYTRETIVVQESEALDAIKDALTSGDSTMSAVRKGFRDYIVLCDAAGNYVFQPINYKLKMHKRDPRNVKKLQTGEWQYVENGRTISHKGIDVSSHQGDIDWKKVAADGVEYAVIRAGLRGYETGKIKLDDKFQQNITGAKENGIRTGVYFFSQAINEEEIDEEADFILEAIAPYEITGPVVIDVETTADGVGRADTLSTELRTDLVVRFCEKIKEAGYRPMIYYNFEAAVLLTDVARLEEYDKWYASYSSEFYYPYYYGMWQYTANGRVDGIEENVDLDMIFDEW